MTLRPPPRDGCEMSDPAADSKIIARQQDWTLPRGWAWCQRQLRTVHAKSGTVVPQYDKWERAPWRGGLRVGCPALLCAALPCRNQEKERKERKKGKEKKRKKKKEGRNEGAGMPNLVEHKQSRKSLQQCWRWFTPVPGS